MGQTKFDGLALVAFDVTIEETKDFDEYGRVKKATFVANPESTSTAKATFLRKFKEERFTGRFSAEVVEGEKLTDCLTDCLKSKKKKKKKKKPLFCVHGWQNRPDYWLGECQKAQKAFGGDNSKYLLVPVLWPANDNGPFLDFLSDRLNFFPAQFPQFAANYKKSRNDARRAAKCLTNAIAQIDDSISMDILGYSMGTYVMKELAKHRYATNESFAFDNIFLSAADIRGDIFTRPEGDYIVKMLRDGKGGKVHAFFNTNDIVLEGSTTVVADYRNDPDDVDETDYDVDESGSLAQIGGFIWGSIVSLPRILSTNEPRNPNIVKRLGYGGAEKYGLGPSRKVDNVPSDRVVIVKVELGRRKGPIITPNAVRAGAEHQYLFDKPRIEYYKRTLQQ